MLKISRVTNNNFLFLWIILSFMTEHWWLFRALFFSFKNENKKCGRYLSGEMYLLLSQANVMISCSWHLAAPVECMQVYKGMVNENESHSFIGNVHRLRTQLDVHFGSSFQPFSSFYFIAKSGNNLQTRSTYA